MSFLSVYDEKYYEKLGKRADTFRILFDALEKKNKVSYLIIETGCVRGPDTFVGDGASTILFDEFVKFHDGIVHSIDINCTNCEYAALSTTSKTNVVCYDSVKYLWGMTPEQPVDLLYLDSFDIDFNNPHPAMSHTMKEFCAIMRHLGKDTIVAIDDQLNEQAGKGVYVADFMKHLGYERLIDGYQIGWILR